MRAFVVGAVLLGSMALARPAQAQFQNHSIGLSLGYVYLQPNMGFDAALVPPALALDATVYVEHGFDVGLRFALAIQKDHEAVPQQVVLLYPAAELRYFIAEDYFRPYVGANIEFVHAFDSGAVIAEDGSAQTDNFVGLGPVLGFDYFVADEWSVGLAGEVAGYFALNAGAHYSGQVWAKVATHF